MRLFVGPTHHTVLGNRRKNNNTRAMFSAASYDTRKQLFSSEVLVISPSYFMCMLWWFGRVKLVPKGRRAASLTDA